MYTYEVGVYAVVFCLEEGCESRGNARSRRLNDTITFTHAPNEASGAPFMPAYELVKCRLFPTEISVTAVSYVVDMSLRVLSLTVLAHDVIYTIVIEIFHVAAVAPSFGFLALEHRSAPLFAVSNSLQATVGYRCRFHLVQCI